MKTELRYFSMFSGVGGFERGLEAATHRHGIPLRNVGYSEIDKYAIQTYERHWPEHVNFGSATGIDPDTIPDFDLLVAGFPCQPFSIAGAQRGFADTRGTLFFDIARILDRKRPRHFILENVKGLLSHDGGRTIRVIIATLAELGYCVEWQVLNCKDFGPPQNRERIIIVGHLGGLRGRAVFPLAGEGNPYSPNSVSAETAVARTLTAGGNSGGNHSGMTIIAENAPLSLSSGSGRTETRTQFGVVRNNFSGKPEVFVERSDGIATTIDANYWKGLDNHGARTGVAEVNQDPDSSRNASVAEGLRHLRAGANAVRTHDGRA